MVIPMAQPTKRSGSSFVQYRKRVPSDILRAARGRRATVTFPSETPDTPDVVVSVKLGKDVRFSLQTRERALAKSRAGHAAAQLERFFEAVRRGPQPLTQKQRVALSGVMYRELVAEWQDNPGHAQDWELARDLSVDAGESRAALDGMYGRAVDQLLTRKGIVTDAESRALLLKEVGEALSGAAERLRRNAAGDYRKDEHVARFPAWEEAAPSKPSGSTAPALPLDDLFERWGRERGPAASTLMTWSGYMRAFQKHLGHNDALAVQKADVVAWKDALVEAGRAPRTIKHGQIAMIRVLFAYAIANDLAAINPAEGVKLRQKQSAGTRMLPYSDDEVARLLALADVEKSPARRWLPWLMAVSGARVGEVAQLWGSRIVLVEGIAAMKIAPAEDGGTLKNAGSERVVPLHPAVLERGFLEFVRQRGDGPLFYRHLKKASPSGAPRRHASKGIANHLAAWIRENGFTDTRKAPSHALRHWFKTACQRAKVLDSVADAIQGHKGSRGDADAYRHGGLHVMSEAIRSIRVPTGS